VLHKRLWLSLILLDLIKETPQEVPPPLSPISIMERPRWQGFCARATFSQEIMIKYDITKGCLQSEMNSVS
jgi:hypothetical protein